jgi:hypothetical protein
MSKSKNGQRTAMTPQAASRIQSAGARKPGNPTAASGFAPRAQAAASGNSGKVIPPTRK